MIAHPSTACFATFVAVDVVTAFVAVDVVAADVVAAFVADASAPLALDLALSFHADVGLRQVLSAAFGLTFLALGTAITVIAYRGYRRNQSRPMLFIAIGFGLIVFPQAVAAVLFYVVDVGVNELALGSAIQLSQLVGMASILYALRMDV